MAIPDAAKPTPLPTFNANLAFVQQGGQLMPAALQQQAKVVSYMQSMGRIIPCSASGKNVITLTPNDASPALEGYVFGDVFAFWAEQTSNGSVTMTVVPKTGTLATLKAYKTNGSAQAGNGDVVANSVYLAIYAPHLDSAAGGFVLK